MPVEIEHKYLIDQTRWAQVIPQKSIPIKQAYLTTDPVKTIRIRTTDDKGFITIKGKTKGASRPEFEYEIPKADALELMDQFTEQCLEKIRHYVTFKNKIWEVDEFLGSNKGLFVAEIELTAENEMYERPDWVTENVTADHRYANANLLRNPFSTW